jgi:hypothetical protein
VRIFLILIYRKAINPPKQIYDYDYEDNSFQICKQLEEKCLKIPTLYCDICDHAVCNTCHGESKSIKYAVHQTFPLKQIGPIYQSKISEKLKKLYFKIQEGKKALKQLNSILNIENNRLEVIMTNIRKQTDFILLHKSMPKIEKFIQLLEDDFRNEYYSREYDRRQLQLFQEFTTFFSLLQGIEECLINGKWKENCSYCLGEKFFLLDTPPKCFECGLAHYKATKDTNCTKLICLHCT